MKKLIPSILIFFACNKAVQQPEPQPEQRVGGLLPDNPKKVAKVPLMQSYKLNVALRGKPVKGDRSQPVVSIYSPVAGEVVGIVNVTGQATDNSAITSIQLKVNGVPYSSVSNVSYFGFSWDTRTLPDDAYQLTVIATDVYGNAGSASVTVTKNTVIIPPPSEPPLNGYIIEHLPPVRDQGSEGSCVGFAVGYAARSIDWYYRQGAYSYSDGTNLFSPEYLYNQTKFSSDCGSGTAMQTALDFVKNNGIATWAVMPYTSGSCSLLPTAEQQAFAANFKIGSYVKMYVTDTAAIKAMLRANKAVIVSIVTDNTFTTATAEFTWRESAGYSIGHCVILCGYDNSRNAYRIMNSYGTNWGGNGFCWIDFDFFLTRTGTYCYAIN
jgi:hypothetical protein